MEITTIILLLLVPLLVWRIYSRLKAAMVRSPSQLWRHYATVALLAALLGGLAAQVLDSPLALAALALGTVAGAGLGYRNMQLSVLENTPQGFFYTPNLRLGVLIAMLFIGRLLYRGFELYLQMHNGTPLAPEPFAHQPLTVLLFCLLAGHFGAYHLLLARWQRGQRPAPRGPLDRPL